MNYPYDPTDPDGSSRCRSVNGYPHAIRTSFESPWQNGIAERWIEICRRDLHIIVTIGLPNPHRRSLGKTPSFLHPLYMRISVGVPHAVVVSGFLSEAVAVVKGIARFSVRIEFWRRTGCSSPECPRSTRTRIGCALGTIPLD